MKESIRRMKSSFMEESEDKPLDTIKEEADSVIYTEVDAKG